MTHHSPENHPLLLDASTTPFACTIMTAAKGAGHATKELIAHPVTGQPMKNQARDLGIWRGEVQHVQLEGLAALGHLLPTLHKRQALIHGVPVDTVPDATLPLVMEDKLGTKGTSPRAIARTLQYFTYTSPHLLMFDIDPDPYERYTIADATALMVKLASIWPVFAEAGYLSTVSTSSAVYDKQTGKELIPPTGLHVYLLVQGDVARFRDLARVKFWCADTGYCRLATPNKRTGVAAILERCLTDLSVWSPERLDYVAGADVDPKLPFVQRRPAPVLHPGGLLDLDTLPDVTPEEQALYTERLAAEKARIAPERFQICVAHLTATEPALEGEAITQEVTRRLAQADRSHLASEHVIDLASGGTVLAKDITRKHHERACADPLEPDYGPNHAKIFWDADKPHWLICSLAHGFKHLYFPDFPAPVAAKPAAPVPAPPPLAPRTEDPAADLGTVSPCTHTANARRLVRLYTPTLRYVLGLGWILWTGQFWRPDPTQDDALATGFVSGLALAIAKEAAHLYGAAAREANAETRKALYGLAMERGRWAMQSEQRGTIAAGLALAKHALLLEHDKINANPWLFNCHNGTLDLKTGHLRDFCPTDFITHLAPVAYDPAATCPTWEKFVLEVFAEDAEMVAFMQRAIGSSLTGVVQDRALFLLYGPQGHNGKTTTVEAVRDLLGTSGEEGFGYARKVDVMTFMKSKNYEDNLRKAAQLVGARFVYSSEIDEEHRLNEQLIKDMTGGDTMEARRLYKEAFNFKPTFKPWMYGNHKPEIRGTDDALWGRVHLVEFPVSFADRVDLALPSKLRAELPGILNWAIAGCLAWQQKGLAPPAKVKLATASYRKEQDTIGQFVSECCQTGEDYMRCKAAALYAAYRRWAETSDTPPLSQKRFGTYLTTHGYPSDDNATGRGIFRLKIALPALTEDEEEEELEADETANLRLRRLAAIKASDGAVKPQSEDQDANLPNHGSRKPPRGGGIVGSPGSKVRKVSNDASDSSYPIENNDVTESNHQKTKVSNPPSYCPGCGRQSTWLIREGRDVCYKCGTQRPPREKDGV